MTNTRITDTEVFERRYPVILRKFSIREDTGGNGMHRGGDGVVRDIEFRIPVQVSILSERRVYRPYGMAGGEDAQCGLNLWVRKVKRESGEIIERTINLGGKKHLRHLQTTNLTILGKNTASMQPGERIIICTPGGGGYGIPELDEDGRPISRAKRIADPKHAWRGGSLASRLLTQETSV